MDHQACAASPHPLKGALPVDRQRRVDGPSGGTVDVTVPLSELAPVIRSKNAGPTQLTLDLFFRDAAAFARAVNSPVLAADAVARLYGLAAGQVQRYALADISAIKFTLPRRVVAGSPGDGDVYGAQQHGPLLGLTL